MSMFLHELCCFDEFILGWMKRTFVRNETQVALSPKDFDVLSYLVMNPEWVVGREELLREVWQT